MLVRHKFYVLSRELQRPFFCSPIWFDDRSIEAPCSRLKVINLSSTRVLWLRLIHLPNTSKQQARQSISGSLVWQHVPNLSIIGLQCNIALKRGPIINYWFGPKTILFEVLLLEEISIFSSIFWTHLVICM